MNVSSEIKAQGCVDLWLYRNGQRQERLLLDNLVVAGMHYVLSRRLAGGGDPVGRVGFGTGATPPSLHDTQLQEPIFKLTDPATYPNEKSVRFGWDLHDEEGNGRMIRELGLFAGERLVARIVLPNEVEKTSDLSLVGTWTITFSS